MKSIVDSTMAPTIIGAGGLAATGIIETIQSGTGIFMALLTVVAQIYSIFKNRKKK